MKKEYNVTGLDCANCAISLQKGLGKVKGVNFCSVDFASSKVSLDVDDERSKEVLQNIAKISKQINPTAKLTEIGDIVNKVNYIDIITYVIGSILALVVAFATINVAAYYIMLFVSIALLGYKTILRTVIQLKHLKINENTLITISIFGAVAVGHPTEGLMVIALYTLGKMLESRALNYSRKSISGLINNQPEFAILYNDKIEKKVSPQSVMIDDVIIVKPGQKIAVDGIVVEGGASIDKRHLTGESIPVSVGVGDYIESGSIVLDSTLVIRATSIYSDSTVSRIMNLVSNASANKSKTETFISKFASFYTLGVMVMSVVVFVITWLILKDTSTAIYRGLIFLVISCPCAFAISVPLGYFSGIGRCSKSAILVKGSNYLDNCSNLDMVVFDKTGTLTTGDFVVSEITFSKNVDKDTITRLVYSAETNSLHPIAKAICKHFGEQEILPITKFREIAGKGIEFEYNMDKYFVGRGETRKGKTAVIVTCNEREVCKIYLQDLIKSESRMGIESLNKLKIKTMMLTGDNQSVAQTVASSVGVDDFRARLLPEDKYEILQQLKKDNKRVAFVGDGLNDAPALVLSDVGISMGIMGSPATIESSDVVIADDKVTKVAELIRISKRTKKIVLQNIVFSAAVKLTFLLLGALGLTGMLVAVFADVGVTLVAILNSLRILQK